jgi:hypothetical protein
MAWMMVAHSDVTWESTPAALTVDRLVALSVGPRVASLAGRLELMALKKVEYLVVLSVELKARAWAVPSAVSLVAPTASTLAAEKAAPWVACLAALLAAPSDLVRSLQPARVALTKPERAPWPRGDRVS